MALRSTTIPAADVPTPAADQTEPKTLLPERFKAYCDAPDGITKNKYLVYQSHDIDHSINILLRLVGAGWKVRSAYHVFADGRSIRIEKYARNMGLIAPK
jgi:hypothetical protein